MIKTPIAMMLCVVLCGCAVNRQHFSNFAEKDLGSLPKNTKGEPIVFLQQKYTQADRYNTGPALSVLPPMPASSVVNVVVGALATDGVLNNTDSSRVTVRFRPYEGGPPLSDDDRRISRAIWPDFNRLRQDAWAVVRKDADGQLYLAPCLVADGCEPVTGNKQ